MANVLTQTCNCAICNQPMRAGEAFSWHKGTRSVVGGKVGGSYTLAEKAAFRPRHAHDCFGAMVKIDLRAQAVERLDSACAYAAQHGETPEGIAQYRAEGMAKIEADYGAGE